MSVMAEDTLMFTTPDGTELWLQRYPDKDYFALLQPKRQIKIFVRMTEYHREMLRAQLATGQGYVCFMRPPWGTNLPDIIAAPDEPTNGYIRINLSISDKERKVFEDYLKEVTH